MASAVVTIRDAVYTEINTKKSANGYVYNGFNLGKTHQPIADLKDIADAGQVWVVGLASDDTPNKSRTGVTLKEIPVQIAIQRVIDPTDNATLDTMLELEEQIRDTVRKVVDTVATDFTWVRNEALKDENGTIYSFMGLREANFFEAIFTAYFHKVLS